MVLIQEKDESSAKKFICKVMVAIIVLTVHVIVTWNYQALVQTIGYDESVTLVESFVIGNEVDDFLAMHKYYGIGFSILLKPLFLIFDSPVIIYHIMQVCVGCFYMVGAVIAFTIYDDIVQTKKVYEIAVGGIYSVAAVFVPMKFVYVMNEHLYILLNWIIVYMLIKMVEEEQKRRYVFLLIICLIVSLTVHEKAITMWAGVFCSCIIYVLLTQKNILFRKIELSISAIGFILTKYGLKIVKKTYWGNNTVNLANTSSSVLSTLFDKLKYLKNIENYIFPILTFCSQLFFMSSYTSGIFLVSIYLSVWIVWKRILSQNTHNNTSENKIFIIVIYTLICIIITIVVQAISWMPNAEDYRIPRRYEEIFGKRAKLYMRYFCCYCGPLIILFSCYIFKYKDKMIKGFRNSLFIYSILGGLIFGYVSPWYDKYELASSPVYIAFIPFTWWMGEKCLTQKVIGTFIMVCLSCFFLVFILIRKRKNLLVGILICILFVYQYAYNGMVVYQESAQEIVDNNYKVYELVKEISKKEEIDIYMPDMRKEDIRLRFYLYEYDIKATHPMEYGENTVLIYPKECSFKNEEYYKKEVGNYSIYISKVLN